MSHSHRSSSWVERTSSAESPQSPSSANDVEATLHRHAHAFKQHPHISLGVAGHIIHMSGVFVPMVAGELIQDATKYKKTVRLASIVTALAYETMYTVKEYQRQKEQKAKLAECRGID